MNGDYFFKNEQEVKRFFEGHTFKFSFYSDGIIYFETLYPLNIGGELLDYQLGFLFNDEEFFNYSGFSGENGWLDKFAIFDVLQLNSGTGEREYLFLID